MVTELKLDPEQAVKEADKGLRRNAVIKGKKEEKLSDSLPVTLDILEPKKVEKISPETIKMLYPVKLSATVLDRYTNLMNECIDSIGEGMEEFVKENIVGFLDIMKERNTNSIEEYLNAVKFITYKQAGDTNVKAYAKVFPDKIKRMAQEKIPQAYLGNYAGIYAKSKLVTKMQAMLMLPSHIMYQDVFHNAVKVQAEIMNDPDVSPKVRSDAANSLMTHLKQPEIKQMELQIGTKNEGAIAELTEALNALSGKQRELILEGKYTTKELREAEIIEVQENE